MPIFTLIGTAIAGALFGGSVLAATLIAGGLAFGVKLALSYLNRPKKRNYSAVQGDTQFGGDVPVGTLYGIGKVRGQRLFYAKYGSGNKFNAEVFALANGWCDGLEPYVYFFGEKHDLVERTIIGNEVKHYGVDGFDDLISIRFYDGRPGQDVDTKLVSDTADLGQTWKSTSVCTGLTYVVIEREYDGDKFSSGRPEFDFVLRGLREYDPRKDSTVAGGLGSQRIDNPSTWAFTKNPAVHRLNYQFGLRGLISGRTLIGEGKSLGQLDLGTYVAAMNVCDTLKVGRATYECALFVSSDDDHTEVLKEFDDAMAGYGLNRRGLSSVIPGAPQIPVLEITSDDIPIDRAQEVQRRKSAFDLFNHLSGQFTSIESQWAPESLKPIYVNADVAADGRPRQTTNDFLQVTDPDIAQYLLAIRYRQNRKGGSATVPVSRRVGLAVQEGEWVTFDGTEWLITGWQCDDEFRFTLTLAETSADIYDDGDIEPGPIIVPSTPPVNPSLLATVQDFNVEVGTIAGADGEEVPALRFTWTPPADPSIVAVRFEYVAGSEPTGETIYRDQTADAEAGLYITSKDVRGGQYYSARATITTRPDRFKSWTQWKTTDASTSMSLFPVGFLSQITGEVQDLLDWMEQGVTDNTAAIAQELIDRANAIAAEATTRDEQIAAERDERLIDGELIAGSLRDLVETVSRQSLQLSDTVLSAARESTLVRQEIGVSYGAATAYADSQILVATGPSSAIAGRLTTLEARFVGVDGSLSSVIQTLQQAIADGDAGQASALDALKLQVRGTYTGNDLTLVTEGLLYQERQTRIAEDQALSTAISLVSAGIGILFDWVKNWSFDTTIESWTGNGTPTWVTGGYLRPGNHASDPYVTSPTGLAVASSAYRQVKAYITQVGSPTWEGYCWYKRTGDSTWDSARRASLSAPTFDGSGRAVVTWDMAWDGTIDQIRLDLSTVQDASNYFLIDWIDIGRPSPGASQAQVGAVQTALASQIAAEASSRETLSTALVGQTDPTGLTLATLTSGLVYSERVARSNADDALSTSITAVQANLTTAQNDITGLATAQSTLSGQVSTLDGRVTLNTTNIADAVAQLAGKASIGVTDALQAQIDAIGGGGNTLSAIAQAVRSLQLSAQQLALGQSDLFLSGQRQRIDLSAATVSVQQAMEGRIDVTDGNVTLLGQQIATIQLALPDLATLTITNALSGRVTVAENNLSSQGSALTSIQAALTGYTGANAISSAFSTLDTKVTNQGGQISSLADAVTSVQASLGDATASANLRFSASAGPSGYAARIGMQARAGGAGTYRSASLFLDVPTATGSPTRIVALANQFVIADPSDLTNLTSPILFSGGAAYLNVANIGTVNSGKLQSLDGKVVFDLTNKKLTFSE